MRRSVSVLGLVVAATVVLGPTAAGATATGDPGTTAGARVGGSVHLDLDGDGVRDDGEPGRAGVAVTLRGTGAVMDAVVTGPDGRFGFERVTPGRYTIAVDPPGDLVASGDGRVRVDVGSDDLDDAAVIGLATSVEDGPDLAVDVHDVPTGDPTTAAWSVGLHNLGDQPVAGPVHARVVLDGGHEVATAEGAGWTCDGAVALATCVHEGDLAPGAGAVVTVRTTVTGAPGSDLGVTATVRGDEGFDGAPLNDEDTAVITVGAAIATGVEEGEGSAPILDETGARTLLLAAVAAGGLLLGGAALWVARRR